MKKYDVYGIGNALVDMEIEVSEQFLKDSGVEKGLMILVDEARQNELLQKVEGTKHARSCGGSAANTIIGATQLGAKTFYSCKVASDETGQFYINDLQGAGVNSNLNVGNLKDGTTGKCMVFITPDADRSMNSFLGITETFSQEEIIWDELSQSEYLYMEGYLVTSDTARAAAIAAREHAQKNGVKVALTFSDPGIVGFFKEGFKEMIGPKIDLLFCNESEAMSYTDTSDVHSALNALKSITNQMAITCGEKGALLWDGQSVIEIPTEQVEARDTNGAGDMFAGAFLYGITNNLSFKDAGKLACACSSQLVTEFGARMSKEKTKKIYSELF